MPPLAASFLLTARSSAPSSSILASNDPDSPKPPPTFLDTALPMTDEISSEGWEPVVQHLEERRAAARAMGGDERLQKHRGAGKLDARARIDHLLDAGSFHELGTLVGGEEAPAD